MASTQASAVITYHKPGTRPPLYVAGTFSNPPWQPCKMDSTAREDGEYDFKKEVRGAPGSEIQYKFRIGDGNWWVLQDDHPTAIDGSGNTNNVLELKAEDINEPQNGSASAAQHLQPPAATAAERSGAGTPIFARVAAEVADSAALLHEDVPPREVAPTNGPEQVPSNTSRDVAPAEAQAAPNTIDLQVSNQNTILVLEPPPGEGRPFQVQPQGYDFLDDQDGYIADRSPLFAHECIGLYESDDELDPEPVVEEEPAPRSALSGDLANGEIDLNDPTLERFPSNREDIMDAVRKLETGLQADQAYFEGPPHSPVVMSTRRGTEDITGDFLLAAPQPQSPNSHRISRRSPQSSVGSIVPVSLQSISEAEEPAAEDELSFLPAVVFSNPLKPKPKHLKLPTSDEDEGIALPDGASPTTAKPVSRSIVTPETSPPASPLSPKSGSKPTAAATTTLDSLEGPRYAPAGTDPASPSGNNKATAPPSATEEAAAASTPPQPGDGGDQSEGQPETEQGHQEGTATAGQIRNRTTGAQDPVSAPGSVPAVQPKEGGRSWVRTIFRFIVVDLIGGVLRRVWRVLRFGRRRGEV
ncbi:hypothetical protein C8A05DRAFT_11915 [Staphylotrichum tortipilum]|uniref:AMP-activated protein kinase glycogen-binding domain-containing protein n=1 Tax=Staphylotrichum tortipilum TaxID=2831512 RepID=A0AAN6MTK3_9PEZI|nr:hypothetical protein C8A05DRAFT_11915 [Staphylotrichum longicolle]